MTTINKKEDHTMLKVEFEFQTPEEAAVAIQAMMAAKQAPTTAPPTQAPAPTFAAPPPAPVSPPPAGVPVAAAPTFTREQIMTAGAALIDAGKMADLMTLLNTFGVQAVTQLKPEQLGAFATELRKLGAQI